MGTKNNPGKFDCYEAADPDEPMFVLLARDPMAPILVTLWAAMRTGSENAVATVFHSIKTTILPGYAFQQNDPEKIEEAQGCATKMLAWRLKNRPARADTDKTAITLVGSEHIRVYRSNEPEPDRPVLFLSTDEARALRDSLTKALSTQRDVQDLQAELLRRAVERSVIDAPKDDD